MAHDRTPYYVGALIAIVLVVALALTTIIYLHRRHSHVERDPGPTYRR